MITTMNKKGMFALQKSSEMFQTTEFHNAVDSKQFAKQNSILKMIRIVIQE